MQQSDLVQTPACVSGHVMTLLPGMWPQGEGDKDTIFERITGMSVSVMANE